MEILSWAKMRIPTWWFRARKTGLKETKREGAAERDQLHTLTLLPDGSEYCPPRRLMKTLEENERSQVAPPQLRPDPPAWLQPWCRELGSHSDWLLHWSPLLVCRWSQEGLEGRGWGRAGGLGEGLQERRLFPKGLRPGLDLHQTKMKTSGEILGKPSWSHSATSHQLGDILSGWVWQERFRELPETSAVEKGRAGPLEPLGPHHQRPL